MKAKKDYWDVSKEFVDKVIESGGKGKSQRDEIEEENIKKEWMKVWRGEWLSGKGNKKGGREIRKEEEKQGNGKRKRNKNMMIKIDNEVKQLIWKLGRRNYEYKDDLLRCKESGKNMIVGEIKQKSIKKIRNKYKKEN